MNARILSMVGLIALMSGLGCAQPGTAALPKKEPGSYVQELTVNGVKRSFVLRVPKAYDATTRLPLVVLLHGWGGNANQIQSYTKFGEKAEQEGFFLAVPQGLGQTAGWNVDFLDLSGRKQDESAFIGAVLDKTEAEVGVDPARIYIAGHSNGGMLAHLAGSKLSNRVAAIGAVAGTIGVPAAGGASLRRIPEPATPISVMIIHGKLDPLVAYSSTAQALLRGIGVADTAEWWAEKIGAAKTPKQQKLGTSKASVETFSGGKGGSEVVVVSLDDGKHEWPGQNGGNIIATDLLWDFFKAHPKKPD